mmetsp:Transcript_57460/g.115354  ORF Transcript_57460/g.115354 Transcript_57460/m.115354 type:complete len:452 (-) Transcript_57460:469-1824(-)
MCPGRLSRWAASSSSIAATSLAWSSSLEPGLRPSEFTTSPLRLRLLRPLTLAVEGKGGELVEDANGVVSSSSFPVSSGLSLGEGACAHGEGGMCTGRLARCCWSWASKSPRRVSRAATAGARNLGRGDPVDCEAEAPPTAAARAWRAARALEGCGARHLETTDCSSFFAGLVKGKSGDAWREAAREGTGVENSLVRSSKEVGGKSGESAARRVKPWWRWPPWSEESGDRACCTSSTDKRTSRTLTSWASSDSWRLSFCRRWMRSEGTTAAVPTLTCAVDGLGLLSRVWSNGWRGCDAWRWCRRWEEEEESSGSSRSPLVEVPKVWLSGVIGESVRLVSPVEAAIALESGDGHSDSSELRRRDNVFRLLLCCVLVRTGVTAAASSISSSPSLSSSNNALALAPETCPVAAALLPPNCRFLALSSPRSSSWPGSSSWLAWLSAQSKVSTFPST